MKINKKTRFAVLSLGVFFIFSSFAFLYWSKSKVTTDVMGQSELNENQKITAIKVLGANPPDLADEKARSLYDSMPKKLKRYYGFGFNSLEEVLFYGQVVDQYNIPVSGARVAVDVGGRYLAAGSGRALVETDNDGKFSLKAEGGNLAVGPIYHSSVDEFRYLAVNEGHQILDHVLFFGYQHRKDGNDLIWLDYTVDNPYLFRVWRAKENEYATKLYRGDFGFHFDCEKNTYSINFPETLRKRKVRGENHGQLNVRFECQKNENSKSNMGWSVEVEPVEGGIQETEDLYLNVAPEEGYESSYRVTMKLDDPNYRDEVIKSFYFYARNNQYYGSVRMRFDPYTYENPRIFMDYKVNPIGQRYLQER